MNWKKNLQLWILIGAICFIAASLFADKYIPESKAAPEEVTFTKILEYVDQDQVKEIEMAPDKVTVELKDGKKAVAFRVDDPELVKTLKEKKVTIKGVPDEQGKITFGTVLFHLLPVMLIIAFWIAMYKSAGSMNNKAMGFGKARTKGLSESKDKITFKDVAGVEEAKEEVEEIVEYLKEPEKFQRLGGKIPRGVLLVGSPGTGKTLLAKAIAGEADVPFLTISGSDFVEMFVGVGASRVRDLFEKAKKQAPCIVFIDEIDAVGRHRGAGLGGGNDEREQTLNQLLVEMDGFETNNGVILIAATNRPDVLDPALLRPGRFDREVMVPLPDVLGREKILEVHVKKIPLSKEINLTTIARGTPGFSGADLANLVNEAALWAARKNKRYVTQQDFEYAKDKVLMGSERKSMKISEEERKMTAYHEAGHAICGLNVKSDPIHKATIVPRGRALGLVQQLPEKDYVSISKEKLESRMVVCFGGRIAEEMIFGKDQVTTGAESDIKMATAIARQMVARWGMDEDIGVVVYEEPEGDVFLGYEIARRKNISDKTAEHVDAAIKKLIDKQYDRAKKILKDKKKDLDRLAKGLLEYETLTGDEITQVLKGKKIARAMEIDSKTKRKSLPDLKEE